MSHNTSRHRFADEDSDIKIVMTFKRNGKVYEMEMYANHATLETTAYYPDYIDADLHYCGIGRTESVILSASIKEREGGKYGRTRRID